MSTAAQVAANQLNAQLSTGPKTEDGKAASAHNNFRHGFTGAFAVLAWENPQEFDSLYASLQDDHQPSTITEHLLVQNMAQSWWLRQRALMLQTQCFDSSGQLGDNEKQLALYLRYQTTNDRAFHKSLDQLTKLRAEKRKQEIGFESQERKRQREDRKLAAHEALEARKEAQENRRIAAEHRAQEFHAARISLTEAHTRRHETEILIANFTKMSRMEQPNTQKAA